MTDKAITKKNLLLVVSGPSGVGKSTIVRELLDHPGEELSLQFSISATTRQPRPGEKNGVHYHFVSEKEFLELRDSGKMLEWAKVHGGWYGTPESNLDEAFDAGCDLLLEIDVQGAAEIKRKRPEAVLVFITAPMETIRERLTARPSNLAGEELRAQIALRMKNAEEEMEHIPEYDYLVSNKKLDDCKNLIISIIAAEKCKIQKCGGCRRGAQNG